MKFLHTKYQFKAVAQILQEYLRARNPEQRISESELFGVLLRQVQLSEGEAFASGIERLTYLLNSKPESNLGRSELLQMLSSAFSGESYQHLEANLRYPTSFREIFPDVEVSACSLKSGERMEHPFPVAYRELEYLHEWRQVWERDAVSTRDCVFFPPMLPPSYFNGNSIKYECRRSWRHQHEVWPREGTTLQDGRQRHEEGTCCVMVRGDREAPIAGVRWFWWGHADQVAGVEYTMLLRRRGKWLFTQFDLRHDRHVPSYGPFSEIIQGEQPDSFIQSCFKSMSSISPSKA